MIVAAIVAPLVVLWALGHLYSRSLNRALVARYPRDLSGVIVGAGEVNRQNTSGKAVLLIHGAGDTPQTLSHLCDGLGARGFAVAAPLLPGHGRSLSDLSAHSADDWYSEVRDRHVRLRQSHSWVGVVGLSMGGALAARLAADTGDVDALVLVAPYLAMPAIGDLAVRTSFLWGFFIPFVRTSSQLSVRDPEARSASLSYGAMSTRALRALRETAKRGWDSLGRIRAPTLIVQSKTDNRVSTTDTLRAYELLGSEEKAIEWVEGAGHVITVDYGWQRVALLVADWMDSHTQEANAKGAP
jgi:carboxylesterase